MSALWFALGGVFFGVAVVFFRSAAAASAPASARNHRTAAILFMLTALGFIAAGVIVTMAQGGPA